MLKVRRLVVAPLFPQLLLAPAQQQPAVAALAVAVESRLLAAAVVAAALAIFQCPKYLEVFLLAQSWGLCCAVMQPWPDSSQ